MIPAAWLTDIQDEYAFMCEVDPDWKDHYGCIEVAMDHMIFMHPEEFDKHKKAMKGTGIFRD